MKVISDAKMTKLANAAFLKAMDTVIETAERAGTPVIVWENGAMAELEPAEVRKKMQLAARAKRRKR
ncbi:MAG TPA: hypothetical protein VL475_01325 [Planctomycetaceae bacterium]|jgi:hypothetical protein|nr:hypothetical protein [Planctomycetaceae bacterium]